ncbi:hypothetical protein [Paenibacillus radicis (ex Gao et al. 2016)]|uniref:hypothetical protein n=1 Tax=Paenibacillus radicis (ex Gao et al. 2016) TaxID=1737354 RepID=UPI001E62E79D|nr:hypothetical protein [Paenibacillus radicis (ex Gao et al. 2016)]
MAQDWVLSQPVGSISETIIDSNNNKTENDNEAVYSYSNKGLLDKVTVIKNGEIINILYKYDPNGNLLKKTTIKSLLSGNKVYEGIYSQKVAGYQIPKNSFFSIYQTFVVEPEKAYQVSGYINVQMLKHSKFQMYIDFYDSNGSIVGSNIADYKKVDGTFEKFENTGVTPSSAVIATLHFLIRAEEEEAAGGFHVDNTAFYYK